MYTDVLKIEKSREHYNRLCKFRMVSLCFVSLFRLSHLLHFTHAHAQITHDNSLQFYNQILLQEGARIKTAQDRMGDLRDSLRKAKAPLPLQEEVDLALKLLQLRLDKIDS